MLLICIGQHYRHLLSQTANDCEIIHYDVQMIIIRNYRENRLIYVCSAAVCTIAILPMDSTVGSTVGAMMQKTVFKLIVSFDN